MKQCRLGLILVLLLFFALSACKGTDIENAAQTQTFFETERDRKLQETSKARWEDIDEDSDASLEDSREESDTPPFSEEEAAETVADGSGRDCPTSEQAFELLREKECPLLSRTWYGYAGHGSAGDCEWAELSDHLSWQ